MDSMTTTHMGTRVAAAAVNVVKVYGEGDTAVRALDGVTVELPAGLFTAIMGPSGSGKSTLMHCLAGLDTLTSGQVFVGDTELGSLADKELTLLRRDRIGFVFQAFNLVPTLTALENITLPAGPGRPHARAGSGSTRSSPPSAWATGCAPPVGAVRRPAAAGRRGPGPGQPARHRLRRRAHRQPRLPRRRRDPRRSSATPSTSWARRS